MQSSTPDGESSRTLSVRLQGRELKALEAEAEARGQSVSDLVREAIALRLNPPHPAAQISAGVGTVVGSIAVQLSSNVLVAGWTSTSARDTAGGSSREGLSAATSAEP